MKKTGIVLIGLILGLALGCKKKSAEPQPVQMPPVAVSSLDVPTTANADPVTATAKTESVPATINEPAPADHHLVWMTDFDAAKKKASAEGKDLLLDFTGSDWCPGCIQLEKEVLSQKIFIYEAQKHFVLVMVDFPRKKKLPLSLEQQNENLARQYSVEVFPTIILADATGKPYANPTYRGGGPLNYLQELAKMQLQKPAK